MSAKNLTDPRLTRMLDGAPPWARLLTALTIAAVSPETVDAALDSIEGKSPDFRTEVLPGRKLMDFNGKTKAKILAEVGSKGLAKVVAAFEQLGMRLEDGDGFVDPSAKPQASQPKAPKKNEQTPGGAAGGTPPVTPHKPDAGDGKPADADPEVVPGVRLSQLAGKKVEEILKHDGISPARAKEISELPPAA
ncbi:MAG TPA: hypothetical protein VK324_05595 [Tepidisphaeraceae bacterium]|nr:hypothetical protein [Tepidisphaeraceae bacterium]